MSTLSAPPVEAPPATPVPSTRRAWATTGVVAGLLGITSIQASGALSANWLETAGDPEAIVADLADRVPTLLLFHTSTVLCMVLVLVFAAGLVRRLKVQAPADSLLPTVAGWGLVLVSVAGLLGSGLDTQFIFALEEREHLVTSSGAFYADWIATVPWLWVGAGVSAMAVAVAALRHAAAPRWIGFVSVVLGGLTLLTGLSPLQYLAGMVGPVWLTVVALGFAFGDRR